MSKEKYFHVPVFYFRWLSSFFLDARAVFAMARGDSSLAGGFFSTGDSSPSHDYGLCKSSSRDPIMVQLFILTHLT